MNSLSPAPLPPERDLLTAMRRGFFCRCPACGQGRLFRRYLKVAEECSACGEEMHYQRADDAPPYFVIFIVGHIVVPLAIAVEAAFRPDYFVHVLLWLPLTVTLSLLLLPPVKGVIVGLQWANRMHGFGGEDDESVPALASRLRRDPPS